jgi:hypothetical protein
VKSLSCFMTTKTKEMSCILKMEEAITGHWGTLTHTWRKTKIA